MAPVSRRGVLSAGVGAAGLVGAGAGGFALGRDRAEPASSGGLAYDLYGPHQRGIVEPAQDRLHFAAFDLTTTRRDELVALLQEWTVAAARMMRGQDAGETGGDYDAPPQDTGEAIGLPPGGLTVTFGFGPSLFDDRFGLADRRPEALRRLPHFPADALDPERSDGDLCVQACAEDPQVAVHAIRNLARIAMGRATVRWSQLGFGRTSSTSTAQSTPRNLFGFKDGTANIKSEESDAVSRHVWVGADQPGGRDWMVGGSYLVARRINMTIEIWDRQSLSEQEKVIGRSKAEGAPLSGGKEFDEPDFALSGRGGTRLVDPASHVALAHPDHNDGARMLRRGYNFVDGSTDLGRLDAGLFFLAFVADPRTQYIPMQTRLATDDLLSEYLQHTGSALFAIPPGVEEGDYVGSGLFA